MKHFTLLLIFLFAWLLPQAHKLTFSPLPFPGINSHFGVNVGLEGHGGSGVLKDSLGIQYSIKKIQGQKAYLQNQRLSAAAYERFRQMALAEDFMQSRTAGKTYTELFQKKDITISAKAETDAQDRVWYDVVIEKRALPRMKDLQFAEDLLVYNSHQHLVFIFGQQNVIRDKFYKADGTAVDCSVIFPGSSREVVFLWQDAANLRQLHSICIGGNTHTAGAQRNGHGVAQNKWTSKQGLYATMTLNQLQARNANTLRFYGWGGGSRGTLCQNNSGMIDFSAMDLSFGCLNCNDDAYYGKQQLASDKAIEDDRRIFIATMIFYPTPAAGE